MTVLCITSYFKGDAFIRGCKERGAKVILITSESLKDYAWPHDALDGIYFMPVVDGAWVIPDLIKAVSHLGQSIVFDRIVALDDLDLEKAAMLREHLRVPGMGDTRTRFFRDKLVMRMRATECGLAVPRFVHVLNDGKLEEFFDTIPPPWIIKPRSAAGSIGVKKLESSSEAWSVIHSLGDERSNHLIEAFLPGTVYHVDSIVFDDEIVFARAHGYMDPPMAVSHEGGIFRSHTLRPEDPDRAHLLEMNAQVITGMGLSRGVSHTEFIKYDGSFFFLETSARVGGAHLAEMIEASSGLNLWREWAHIETLEPGARYELPPTRLDHAGIINSLARQEHPDTSKYTNPEIVWRMDKSYHAGMIVKHKDYERVVGLLDELAERFRVDFHAWAPMGKIPPP
ncbi:MAG: hypothetical protein WBW88_08025 [Rhodothermales bacterium]